MSKIKWTEITAEELKAILTFINDQRHLFSTFKSDMLPEEGEPCTHSSSSITDGHRLNIELRIERK